MDPEMFNNLSNIVPQSVGSGTGESFSPFDNITLDSIDSTPASFSMPGLGTLMGVGGSFLGAYGNILQGQEQQEAYEYNANLALTQGQFAVQGLDDQELSTLSSQKAMYAKAGVTMSGSPLDTALNTASNFEMDKQITKYNAQSKANMDRYTGKVAKQQADFKAGMSILSGASDLAFALV